MIFMLEVTVIIFYFLKLIVVTHGHYKFLTIVLSVTLLNQDESSWCLEKQLSKLFDSVKQKENSLQYSSFSKLLLFLAIFCQVKTKIVICISSPTFNCNSKSGDHTTKNVFFSELILKTDWY